MAFKLKIDERSFGGRKFRPRPRCYHENEINLFLCITPWGSDEITEVVVESIKTFLAMANEDTEVTVPFARKETLNKSGNVLRMAIIMASEKIYKDYNKENYSAGFEIFAGILQGHQWTYVCCGQPSLVLLRNNVGSVPIHHNLDLNVRVTKKVITDPLPDHILGMGQHPPIQFGSITVQKGDNYLLASRSYIPESFFAMPRKSRTLESVSKCFAEENAEIPFWLGMISID